MCVSGSVLGIQILKAPAYGSNRDPDPDPQHIVCTIDQRKTIENLRKNKTSFDPMGLI